MWITLSEFSTGKILQKKYITNRLMTVADLFDQKRQAVKQVSLTDDFLQKESKLI
jgi:hypothetical protein